MATKHPRATPEPFEDEPDETPTEPAPEDAPAQPEVDPSPRAAALTCFLFDRLGRTWRDSFHAATDHPLHPLRHLKGI